MTFRPPRFSAILAVATASWLGSALLPAADQRSWDEIYAERQNWWSLKPVKFTAPPPAQDGEWAGSDVDCFLRDRMSSLGVTPAPRADAATLLRRAALVLTGLPPTPQESTSFLISWQKDPTSAYSALVDRLLASPHFGECWTRHWLDVVRFTETLGNEWNYDAAYAWRYRDYIIRAFNSDLPYDQFVREHIAGDLMTHPRWNAAGRFNESAIGTAFYRFGEVNHDSCVQFNIIGYDVVDNQLDTLTKAFQATTVACARCHDHKLDAISTKDYHALLAVLRSSRSVMRTLDRPETNQERIASLHRLKEDVRDNLISHWRTDAGSLSVSKLRDLAAANGASKPALDNPLRIWLAITQPKVSDVADTWRRFGEAHARDSADRASFNQQFTQLADFRHGVPAGWFQDGEGLRQPADSGGDIVITTEGDHAIQEVLPAGLYTYSISSRLNGALRSPTLPRIHSKVSFEVEGGRFSLARLVFNNCQLNYNHQHSIHNDTWKWITVDFPENTDELHPYAELLTFWDNPKFPDPLGALGKDTENQRGPYAEYVKDPHTWWGIRRVVLHDHAETPRDETTFLSRLFESKPPATLDAAAAVYAKVATGVVEAFAAQRATDDDVRWLNWLVKSGLITNSYNADPHLAELIAHYREIESGISAPTTMPGLADEGDGFAQPILNRGDPTQPGEKVAPGYIQMLSAHPSDKALHGSGRAGLADIMANAGNPLTARVMVNRVWQWVFGRGIVATPDDFGHLGALPDHPALLDDLTATFIKEGWSIKNLARHLVLSRAFQASSAATESAHRLDPENICLSHYPARRAEAEVIRDSLLAVSGRLEPQMYGPSVPPYREKADPEKRLFVGPLDGNGRRSIYLKFQLMEAPRFLCAFNLPGGKVTQGRRETSNTPTQSLALLNDPFVIAMAEHWAEQLVRDHNSTVEARAKAMFQKALSRAPSDHELQRFTATIRTLAANRGSNESDLMRESAVWQDAAHILFNLKEFIFIP